MASCWLVVSPQTMQSISQHLPCKAMDMNCRGPQHPRAINGAAVGRSTVRLAAHT